MLLLSSLPLLLLLATTVSSQCQNNSENPLVTQIGNGIAGFLAGLTGKDLVQNPHLADYTKKLNNLVQARIQNSSLPRLGGFLGALINSPKSLSIGLATSLETIDSFIKVLGTALSGTAGEIPQHFFEATMNLPYTFVNNLGKILTNSSQLEGLQEKLKNCQQGIYEEPVLTMAVEEIARCPVKETGEVLNAIANLARDGTAGLNALGFLVKGLRTKPWEEVLGDVGTFVRDKGLRSASTVMGHLVAVPVVVGNMEPVTLTCVGVKSAALPVKVGLQIFRYVKCVREN